ncbi:MAG TPA: hypothetical protein VF607_04170 [Verrucomicrobiae bacterium]
MQMARISLILPLVTGLILLGSIGSGCSTKALARPQEISAAAVAKDSKLTGDLFAEAIDGPGGLGGVDEALFPRAKNKQVIKIEVLKPFENHQTGLERWTVQHDNKETCAYLIRIIPDANGGTTFITFKDDGSLQ